MVLSVDFRPPAAAAALCSTAPRSCGTRFSSLRTIESVSSERRANLRWRSCSSARSKIRVGAMAGALSGQQMGFALDSGARWTASTWLDNYAQVEADVPLSEAWALWSNQENVVNWMPWIASVKVMEGNPNTSKWTLRYSAFGQDFEFSWMARLLKPIQNQKIHWRSVDGLANRGAVRFYPRGPTSCGIELTISYEVPDVLVPFASVQSLAKKVFPLFSSLIKGVKPLVERILKGDLERFAVYAKSQSAKKTIPQQ